LFHNYNIFGSCIIHILYTGCAKIKKKSNSGAKRLNCTIWKEIEVNLPTVLVCELVRKSVETSHGDEVNILSNKQSEH